MRRSRAAAGGARRLRVAARRRGWHRTPLPLDRGRRRVRRPCSTATTGCCAPSPRRTAAGACRVEPERRRSALSRHADRLRGPALPRAPRRRSAARSRAPAASSSRHGRIVSGGSTLTMQVARLLEGQHERTGARQAPPDRCARCSSSSSSSKDRDPARSICGSRRSAATSKACARPRSPISARSRAVCRSARRRCWWRCRSRPRARRPDRNREAAPRARATACSTAPSRPASSRRAEAERAKAEPRADRRAASSRSSRRIWPRPRSPREPDAAHPSPDHRPRRCRRALETLAARADASCSARSCRPP